MSRYWRRLWNCSVCCLVCILIMATQYIYSFQEQSQRHVNQTSKGDRESLVGNLTLRLYSWGSLQAKYSLSVPYEINIVAQKVYQANIPSLLKDGMCPGPEHCFLVFHHENPDIGPSSWYPLSTFKEAKGLKKSNLKISGVKENDHRSYVITLSTDFPAPFVWLEAYGIRGRFCDNGFLMFEETKSVTFHAWEATDLVSLKNSLTVKSLMDIYH